MMSRILLFALTLCLVMGLDSSGWALSVGDRAPEFTVQTLEGSEIQWTPSGAGQTLLVFWNTWCIKCRKELPALNTQLNKLWQESVQVLAVNTAINDSVEEARHFWQEQTMEFPSGFDQNFSISHSYQVLGVPTFILVDPAGRIRYVGASPPEGLLSEN